MKKTIITLALTAALAGAALASDFRIGNVYRAGTMWATAVVHTDKTIRVKCAALDSKGEAIAVSSTTTINPPMDEVVVNVGRNVPFKSMRCWIVK